MYRVIEQNIRISTVFTFQMENDMENYLQYEMGFLSYEDHE